MQICEQQYVFVIFIVMPLIIFIVMPLIIGGKEGEEASCWFEQQLAPAGTSGLRWFPLSTPSRGALPPVACTSLLLILPHPVAFVP